MTRSQHHTLALLQVHHELEMPSGLEVGLLLAAADINELKEWLSLGKAATKLCKHVFFMYNTGLHHRPAETFDVYEYLSHDVLDMVFRIDQLQVCLELGMELMGSLAATLLP